MGGINSIASFAELLNKIKFPSPGYPSGIQFMLCWSPKIWYELLPLL